MADTIFSRIVRGEIPCHRVHEDEQVLAFLDIAPLSRGHTLVVPKEGAATMADLSDDAAAGLGRALPRICRAVRAATGCAGLNLLQNNGEAAGQEVEHVHVHVIPRFTGDASGGGLRVRWEPTQAAPEDLAALAQEIASRL